MTIRVENFGCRLNALEGDAIADIAPPTQDITLINGCGVTSEAMRQARQAARKAHRANPQTRVIVSGCAAQIDPAMFAAMPEVAQVLGNAEKLTAAAYQKPARVQVGDIMAPAAPPSAQKIQQPNRTRAFVQVQSGCDHRCTFCIIPFGRGNARSFTRAHVLRACETLLAAGHNEIVLTGVDLTSYHTDDTANLGALVRAILNHLPHLPRLRLSSVDAVELDDTLLDLFAHEPRLMPHVHLSLQSGDDLILKRMKRRHNRRDAIDLCARLRTARPDIGISGDIIVGFPTETATAFDNSLALIKSCGLAHAHIFPFSPRPGTPAARMPQLDAATIKARARTARHCAEEITRHWLAAQIGQTTQVLIEKTEDTPAGIIASGRAANFARVQMSDNAPSLKDTLKSGKIVTGQIVAMQIVAHDDTKLIGQPIGQPKGAAL